jgi:hypothetical protein
VLSARGDAEVLGRGRRDARERVAHAPSVDKRSGLAPTVYDDLVRIVRIGRVDGRNDVGKPSEGILHKNNPQ